MKKFFLATFAFATLGLLNACNGIGEKDTLLARINDEKVFQEDIRLLLKNEGKMGDVDNQFLYSKLYSRVALASRALKEFPELEEEWKIALKDLEPRILTMVYQSFYAMECLAYTDEELQRFYNAHKDMFPDSLGNFWDVRSRVADAYYVSKNQEQWTSFLAKESAGDSMTTVDTVLLRKKFADEYRSELQNALTKEVNSSRKVIVNEPPAIDAKAYYEKNREKYKTVAGYEVYHVQGTDSLALQKFAQQNLSLEQFKSEAARYSENKHTAKDSGYVGTVKENFAMPYGIGIVPGFATAVEGKTPGFVTPVLRGQGEGPFHVFYLAKVSPSTIKPFSRVQPGLEAAIKSGQLFDVDSSFVLLSVDGKPLFTEADMMRYNAEYVGGHAMSRSLHERLLAMWTDVYSYAIIAKEKKMDHRWEYRAVVRDTRLDFIRKYYTKKLNGTNFFAEDTLKALYEKYGSPLRRGAPYELAKADLAHLASIHENFYKFEYYMGYRLTSFGKSYEECVPEMFARHVLEYDKYRQERLAAEAYEGASVHFYDETTGVKPDMLYKELAAKADSLYKSGNRAEAYKVYRSVLFAYADVDSIFEKTLYEMGVIENEENEFNVAEACFYTFYRMYPESPNAEKSMFSRAFILSENLGKNKKATEVLEEFLKTYPKSEMKESAEWLLNNIKSNGKLAEELMKKIESEQ